MGFMDGPMAVLILLGIAIFTSFSDEFTDAAHAWGDSTEERNRSYVENSQQYEQDVAEGNYWQAFVDWLALQVQAGLFNW